MGFKSGDKGEGDPSHPTGSVACPLRQRVCLSLSAPCYHRPHGQKDPSQDSSLALSPFRPSDSRNNPFFLLPLSQLHPRPSRGFVFTVKKELGKWRSKSDSSSPGEKTLRDSSAAKVTTHVQGGAGQRKEREEFPAHSS